MGRLTPKDWENQSNEIWLKLGYIQMSDEPFRTFISESLRKLAHYEDLEEAGRLIEQKHGEWILKHVGAGHYWECSVCHTNPCIYVTNNTNYCPNCGAKMGELKK